MGGQLRRVVYAIFFVGLQTSISSADFIVAQNLPASQQYGDYFETIGLIAPNINRFNGASRAVFHFAQRCQTHNN